MILLAPGQIWRDPRNPAREVRISLITRTGVLVQNVATGRHSVVQRENFTAIAILRNRWIFVEDALGERAKLG